MRAKRRILMGGLERVGMLEPSFRLYETALAGRGRLRERAVKADDGLPLPPPKLRVLVAGTPSAQWFLESGRRVVGAMEDALDAVGTSLAAHRSILEFGCGSGRIMRHLGGLASEIYGTDSNPVLVDWCERHLPFGTFTVNGNEPPLPHAPGTFTLVYAVSVFSHMAWDAQRAWFRELRRVLVPGGLLLWTTHGYGYRDRLDADERRRFDAGELVVRREGASGTNLCAAYHPEPFVGEQMAPPDFTVRAFLPARAVQQDVYVLEACRRVQRGANLLSRVDSRPRTTAIA